LKLGEKWKSLGSFPVTLGVTDGKSPVAYTTFYVSVTTDYGHYVYGGGAPDDYYNQAPYFTTTNSYYAINSGNNLRFTVTAIDPESREVRYSVSGLPAGSSFDSATRAFSWTPASNQRGSYTLSFSATDGYATSIPLNITIIVDGGVGAQARQTYTSPVFTTAQQYYPNTEYFATYGCSGVATMPKTAIAGEVYKYNFGSCLVGNRPVNFELATGPIGASITNNVLSWYVPTNAVNKEYAFIVTVSNDLASANVDFTLKVVGGAPTVNTVVTQPKTVVQYVNVPANTVTQPVATNYYPNAQNVYVSTGRTVTPTNYQYYQAGAYGAMLPAPAVSISTFNISVRVSAAKEMIVSWDTNKPTTGEVVFGYSSQTRGADLDRTILNYDFTTGQVGGSATRHEANLGKLSTNQTYYLRVISRADNQTDISREIVFIPMATSGGSIVIEQSEGAASAADSLGAFLVSGGFLSFLLLVIIGLIIYLIVLGRRSSGDGEGHPHAPEHLVFHPEKHR
jgi:hypothetical protein